MWAWPLSLSLSQSLQSELDSRAGGREKKRRGRGDFGAKSGSLGAKTSKGRAQKPPTS